MTLEYYSYSYSCYFRSTNIFGYSFGKYVAFKYIQIFVWYIMWHPKIFGYSFGKYVAFKYIQIFVPYIMWHPKIFGYSFVSIL